MFLVNCSTICSEKQNDIPLSLFSTKSLRKQDSDYEDSKVNKEEINSPFKNIKEEKDSDDNKSEGSFINLLSKINDLDYQGYNYKLKKEDFFKRVPDEPPIETILNSEDAAIKKCEELMNQLENELKWEDPDFGPQPNDNGSGSKKAIYGEYGNAENLGINVNNISWYGIKEINENATFFYDIWLWRMMDFNSKFTHFIFNEFRRSTK